MSLLTFPTELIHHVLDQLDINDILFSLRNVCRQFYALTNSYNRYKIRFTSSTPKADIYRICRIIRPENVISLTLIQAHSDRVVERFKLILSLVNIHQFTCLQSLDLYEVDPDTLDNILQHVITVPTFTKLSVAVKPFQPMSDRTVDLLSSILAAENFREFKLYCATDQIAALSWLSKCRLERLTLGSCDQRVLCHILDRLPNLCSFRVDDFYTSYLDPSDISLSTAHMLTSLTLRSNKRSIYQYESLLSYTPALVHLRLTDYLTKFACLQRLSQWESFIRQKLPSLQTFKFHVNTNEYERHDANIIEPLVNAFRTPFWLQLKRWYVTCQYTDDGTKPNLSLYSRSDSYKNFPENTSRSNLSYSMSTTENDNVIDMNINWKVRLNAFYMMGSIGLHEPNKTNHYMFRSITYLALDLHSSITSYQFLSALSDYSQLTEIWLFFNTDHHHLGRNAMQNILNLVGNVPTVGISYTNDWTLIPEDILDTIISHQVKHLIIRTVYEECMQSVVTYARQLTTITFVCDQCSSNAWTHMTRWLDKNGNKYSVKDDSRSLCVYFE
ncbi:unnamed protein product [Adineta ricciae]|uniref:F-box domain-containing protein n=1 Tax=Adineta ricciae TaxID=249248 RepID=A0A814S1C1_ADIRI|nr:unnamed protein product [Adineta ricciae]CAF1269030.1 unnamed protein product [Adineta ricciae]